MTWAEVLKMIALAVASLGGIGVVISAIVAFTANLIGKRMEQKFDNQLAMEREILKNALAVSAHVANLNFDKQLQIFGTLSEKCNDLVTATYSLFPKSPMSLEYKYFLIKPTQVDKRRQAATLCEEVCRSLYYHAAFVPEWVFEDIMGFVNTCRAQYELFDQLVKGIENFHADDSQHSDKLQSAWRCSVGLVTNYEEFIKKLRKYISNAESIKTEVIKP